MAQITLNSTGVASSGSLVLQSNGTTSAVTVDASQNVGVGVTPSAWGSQVKPVQIGNAGGQISAANTSYSGSNWLWVGNNSYLDSSYNHIYSRTAAASLYQQNVGIHSWYNAPSGTAGNAITFTQAMTLDASGNLMVGDTTASGRLTVKRSNDGNLAYFDGTTTQFRIDVSASTIFLNAQNGNGAMAFQTNGTERARITSGGLMLVGTSSVVNAETGLGVANSTSGDAVTAFRNSRNTSGDVCSQLFVGSNCQNTSSYLLQGGVFGVANVFYVFGNGNVQNTNNSYGAISDVKLKENIVDATPKLADLMQVKVRSYNLIGSATKQIGVIAQELETIFPAMIDESPDKDEDGNELSTKTKAVKYSVFVPMLIKAIQELKTEFDAYKASHP